ncbi:helix-turn-helix domain-containing protein [Exiguobacterium sp. s131]|uniref:helix-turn-helix domain-containing protein n=1 Tax=Exiguobacterium sp. s131 TaxID=2751278 RepID=UPI001BEC3021|nr:helix-turn-helix domain-containing protein [Exiguobacterium sp. s131]
MYTIDEAFEILSKNKLTSHKEAVRNWVRKGVIQAELLESRKKGYRISEEALEQFIKGRMPEGWELYPESVTGDARDVVKNEEEAQYHVEVDVEMIREQVREEMWYELLGKFVFED